MNKQTKWWSEVEERGEKGFETWALNQMTTGKLPTWKDCSKWWLSFFHKEIQNRLHEEALAELNDEEMLKEIPPLPRKTWQIDWKPKIMGTIKFENGEEFTYTGIVNNNDGTQTVTGLEPFNGISVDSELPK